ncbi:MAG: Uncharacterised protein [Cyanobium sp. ARS6]|nr:MAG: Uncharacterised protein [Cyanobium sp. ARS6]
MESRVLAALNPQARASGPGAAVHPRLQRVDPTNIQNSGANSPSTAFSLAVSALARRISSPVSEVVSRPTIQLSFSRAAERSSPPLQGRAAITFSTLCSRLLAASALARPATRASTAMLWSAPCVCRAIRSISHPQPALPRVRISVMVSPPRRNLAGSSPHQLSVPRCSLLMQRPIHTTGCGDQSGSPISRSRPAAAITRRKG